MRPPPAKSQAKQAGRVKRTQVRPKKLAAAGATARIHANRAGRRGVAEAYDVPPAPPAMRLPLLESVRPLAAPAADRGPRSMAAVRMLRVSVTDRCNFRCVYCMPADGLPWLPRDQVLSFEEIAQVVRAATELHGVTHVKLTGGEPTVRRDLATLVSMLRKVDGVRDLSMTTNGFSLGELAVPLREAGLDRVTVSLDSLHAGRFTAITAHRPARTSLGRDRRGVGGRLRRDQAQLRGSSAGPTTTRWPTSRP